MKLFASMRARVARPEKPAAVPAPSPAPVARVPIDVSEAYKRFGPRVARGVMRAQRARAEAPKEPPSCHQAGWFPNHGVQIARP